MFPVTYLKNVHNNISITGRKLTLIIKYDYLVLCLLELGEAKPLLRLS